MTQEEAKDLLAEAGYEDGFDATLLSTSQYTFLQDNALSVQDDLEAIGINVTLDSPDWSSRVTLRATKVTTTLRSQVTQESCPMRATS